MRIIGGKYRGKKLISPTSAAVRPTSDKAREALFNILRSRLGGDFSALSLVDVFAGSGAFGLEAVSVGFGRVTLVDIDPCDLQKNIALFPFEKSKIKVVRCDAASFKGSVDDKFDVLFMDAPYQKGLSEKALTAFAPYLKEGALCLIEVEKNEACLLPESYRLLDERRYGLAKVLIAEFIS